MLTRRDLLTAAAALAGAAPAPARGRLGQDDLLAMRPVGNVTLLHVADLHARLEPLWYREPALNPGAGAAAGQPPHLTAEAFLEAYGLARGSPEAYALTCLDFPELARRYGRMGGLDRLATLIGAIRAERPGRTLLLDGGDSLQGSWSALQTRGGDMARALRALGIEATTGHWEFTYGEARIAELPAELGCPFLAGNVVDAEWEEPALAGTATFERGGIKIGVIGQAFPYVPVAHPRRLVPSWSFGIREERIAAAAEHLRAEGAALVALLSHDGFDVDRKLAGRVPGLDVILTAHTHDALPQPLRVGRTLLVASGSHGKFLSRLDLDVRAGEIRDWSYRLIPVLAEAIAPDPAMTALIRELRAPFAAEEGRVLGRSEALLYRRGTVNGTWDDLICAALLERLDAEIAFSPGFRWGPSLLPGEDVTMGDVWAQTAITYPATWRRTLTGEAIMALLEDVADNLFNPDPYYQQGGDMVRVGGLAFTLDPKAPMGRRIGSPTILRTGRPLEASGRYAVAGWAAVGEEADGPPVWEPVAAWIRARGSFAVAPSGVARLAGA
ncbi:thiosulfohydrolase SoxB [Benzoatithermus flavus]|uniref:Thiosulfohydrolase SoxB n=1 Tax=Benzoatithermus flavus TaxID=3108223 RepID=A0ABU8XW78_9PROT